MWALEWTSKVSEALRGMAVSATWVFLAVCLVQLVVLIVHKLLLERRQEAAALVKSRYLSRMYRVIGQERLKLDPPVTEQEFVSLADVCIYLRAGATAEELAIIDETVRRCDIPSFYRHRLARAHLWIERYRIVEKLGFLQLPELAELFRSVLATPKENLHVRARAAWALSLVCRAEDVPVLLAKICGPRFTSSKFNEHLFVNVIAAFRGRGETDALLRLIDKILHMEDVPLMVKRDLLEACGAAGLTESVTLVVAASRHFGDSPVVRIAGLRALQKIGGDWLYPEVVNGLRDEDWRVRAVAAKSVEGCPAQVIPLLEQALGDPHYHVRLNAALSLSHRGEAGREALLRQMDGSDDRFARDVCRYVMRGVSC